MASSQEDNSQTTQGAALEAHHILLQHGPPPTERQPSGSSTASSDRAAMRNKKADQSQAYRPKANSGSSRNTHSSSSTRAESRGTHKEVRTLPPWIDSVEDDDVLSTKPTDGLLSSPSRAHSAQHHYAPSSPARRVSQDGYIDDYDDAAHGLGEKRTETGFFGGHKEPVKGRKWDHARQGDPVIMQSGVPQTSSPWRAYIKSSMYGPGPEEDAERKDEQFLRLQTPGYEKPWRGDVEGDNEPDTLANLLHNKKRQRSMIKRVQHLFLMHPLVPLIFRLVVLTTSVIALALAGSVHHFSNKFDYPQSPSTTMAIVVDVVAIPYILYVTWDEYTGKPLGLRSPKAKIRLVLLDLFFIIFESANLALAFAGLTDDDGACKSGHINGYNFVICSRIKALCAILMIALIAWSFTFAVSIFRLVERVGGREEGD